MSRNEQWQVFDGSKMRDSHYDGCKHQRMGSLERNITDKWCVNDREDRSEELESGYLIEELVGDEQFEVRQILFHSNREENG